LDSLDIKVIFTTPYHPQSNGLCELTNRYFIQNIRILSKQLKTVDWPSLTPLATVIHNSQISVKIGFSYSELLLARSHLLINPIIDSETTLLVKEWIQQNLIQQETVTTRLERLRHVFLKRQIKGVSPIILPPGPMFLFTKIYFPDIPTVRFIPLG